MMYTLQKSRVLVLVSWIKISSIYIEFIHICKETLVSLGGSHLENET